MLNYDKIYLQATWKKKYKTKNKYKEYIIKN